MSNWMAKRITDYWDQQAGTGFEEGAIHRMSRRLHDRHNLERRNALEEIRHRVRRQTNALEDEHLLLAAFSFADDLYKAATVLNYWDEHIRDYLEAVGNSFCAALTSRRVTINYVINNSFTETQIGMAGPVEWYGRLFSSAGIMYICPQSAAWLMIAEAEIPADRRIPIPSEWQVEGRLVAEELVERCSAAGTHFAYLDTHATEHSLQLATRGFGTYGVLGVYRDDPPAPGTKCTVVPPMNGTVDGRSGT